MYVLEHHGCCTLHLRRQFPFIISYHSIASYDTDADAETETDTGDASSACVGYVWLCFAAQYSAMLCSTVR